MSKQDKIIVLSASPSCIGRALPLIINTGLRAKIIIEGHEIYVWVGNLGQERDLERAIKGLSLIRRVLTSRGEQEDRVLQGNWITPEALSALANDIVDQLEARKIKEFDMKGEALAREVPLEKRARGENRPPNAELRKEFKKNGYNGICNRYNVKIGSAKRWVRSLQREVSA